MGPHQVEDADQEEISNLVARQQIVQVMVNSLCSLGRQEEDDTVQYRYRENRNVKLVTHKLSGDGCREMSTKKDYTFKHGGQSCC